MRSRRSARFLFAGTSSLCAALGGRFLPASPFAGRFFAYCFGLSGLGLPALAILWSALSAFTTFMLGVRSSVASRARAARNKIDRPISE